MNLRQIKFVLKTKLHNRFAEIRVLTQKYSNFNKIIFRVSVKCLCHKLFYVSLSTP